MQRVGCFHGAVPVQLVQGAQVIKHPGDFPGDLGLTAGKQFGDAGGGAVRSLQMPVQGGKQGGMAAFPQGGEQGMGRAEGQGL